MVPRYGPGSQAFGLEPERLALPAQAEGLGNGRELCFPALKGPFIHPRNRNGPYRSEKRFNVPFPRPKAWADRSDLSGRKRWCHVTDQVPRPKAWADRSDLSGRKRWCHVTDQVPRPSASSLKGSLCQPRPKAWETDANCVFRP